MRPDPGRDLLEARLASMTPDARARISMDLRARGLALVWDQLDRAGSLGPVEQALFLIDRLYPEMPAIHREQIHRRLQTEHDAGTWRGPQRPVPMRADSGERVARPLTDAAARRS